jgi:hypothetical protein
MSMGLLTLDLTNEEEDINLNIEDFKQIEEILRDDDDDEIFNDENIDKDEKYRKKDSKYKLITRRIDVNRIRHKTAKNMEVYTSILKHVKMESEGEPIRSGVIVYTHYKGKTYFCLGIDSAYGDLTDFAGGVKKDETVIEGGLRELEEESQGIFGKITPSEVQNCTTFYSSNMLIIFIRRDVDMEKIKRDFLSRVNKKEPNTNKEIEVSNIVWLESKDFLDSINSKGRRLYSRVRRILYKVIDIVAAL